MIDFTVSVEPIVRRARSVYSQGMGSVRAATASVSRLRWRLRGAWLWPTYIVLTLGDALLLHLQPMSGTDTGIVPALLLAGFANTLAIALLAPALGHVLRRRDPSLPVGVARDRAGTVLLVGVTGVFVLFGVLHRGAADGQREAFARQSLAAREYTAGHLPGEFRRHIAQADTLHMGTALYRTCVPGDPGHRPVCLYIHTDESPIRVVRDDSRETNGELAAEGRGG
jgi:hypothetical protein